MAPAVVLYGAANCSLCEAALEVVRRVCGDGFEYVPIDGDPELEARYRELLPVVEIDGEPVFTYFVEPNALRERLARR
ncbi:MAG TPA: glutaredoxin family protein [Thermoanaerobaculia bacterium]|nr:glutaredoxin family protein [Thermoanaerobaculia bacterium]